MVAVSPKRRVSSAPPPPLENGDMLTLNEFLRRYEDMPEVNKAQLIGGVVFMPSPVRAEAHSAPDGLIQLWLGSYAIVSGLEFYVNPTLLLDTENSFQPDSVLCSKPREGSRVWLNGKGYLCGSPELVVEVAASNASIDLRDKLRIYRRLGVSEYIVWRTQDEALDWFVLEEGEYNKLTPGRDHKLRSRVFKGLVLDVNALLKLDGAKVLAALKR